MIDQRIAQQRHRIQQHPGDDSQLRDRLQQLRQRRNQQGGRTPAPTPWSGTYESTVGSLGAQRDNTLADVTAAEQATRKAYGFEDSSDPFSRANQLQQSFANANRGTTNNYAAAGQLYAGSLSNAHNIDRTNFETSWDAAQKDYQAKLAELYQRRVGAQTDYDEGVIRAEGDRLQDTLQERVDPAEAPAAQKPNKQKNNKPNKPKKGHK